MAIWAIIEVFRDERLLHRIRRDLSDIGFQGIVSSEAVDKLLAIPLLQSVYSELLRLRVEVQTIFSSETEDIRVNQWKIPQGGLVVVPAGAAHRDPNVWNTGHGKYPLDQFWADRFLVYNGDKQDILTSPSDSDLKGASTGKAKFVNSGLTDTFMPYGIGERTCPGRGFARREIITICALFVERYDIKFVNKRQDFGMSTTFYGIGTQRPRSLIPFRIRERGDC